MTEQQHRTAQFTNISDKPFTGYWDGKPRTFKPGESKYMPQFLAEHFAKHLTNQLLLEQGKENLTSPKFPEQVPAFMEVYNKICKVDDEGQEDALDADIALANRKVEPSSNIEAPKTEQRTEQSNDDGDFPELTDDKPE